MLVYREIDDMVHLICSPLTRVVYKHKFGCDLIVILCLGHVDKLSSSLYQLTSYLIRGRCSLCF